MKQSAAKTLGVAALGAAFAAAAAGTSCAAALPQLPVAAGALDTVTHAAPVPDALGKLPAGAPTSLAQGKTALADATASVPAAVQQAAKKGLPTGGAAKPATGLLGGLPIGGGLVPGMS
ncbi:ATP-binding protein [Streptomyces sp. NPDC002889]|uniref:ATP-binding protein n=1 Tax=Streptomyces sp. NPDC002889 TaxID=3364669 RepID=UPI003684B836